jgi:hypothetical protein
LIMGIFATLVACAPAVWANASVSVVFKTGRSFRANVSVPVLLKITGVPNPLTDGDPQTARLQIADQGFDGTVQRNGGVLQAEFLFLRKWDAQEFLSGVLTMKGISPLPVPSIPIASITPIKLEVTQENGNSSLLRATGDLPQGVDSLRACPDNWAHWQEEKLVLEPATVIAPVVTVAQEKVEILLTAERPQSQAQLTLELCDPSSTDRWVYQEPRASLTPAKPPVILGLTMVRVQDNAGSSLLLWIDDPPADLVQGAKAEIFKTGPPSGLEGTLDFSPVKGERLEARVKGAANLQTLSLKIRSGKNEYQVEGTRPFDVQMPSESGASNLAWSIALVVLQIVGFGWVLQSFRRLRNSNVAQQEAISTTVAEAIAKASADAKATTTGDRVLDSTTEPPLVTGTEKAVFLKAEEAAKSPLILASEASLLQLINQWWAEDRFRSKDKLRAMAQKQRFGDLEFYESAKLEDSLSQLTGRQFFFRPNAKSMEWLFYPIGSGNVLALPLDERSFEAGQALRLVARLFKGVDPQAKSVSFERADQACQLEAVEGGYRLKQQGRIQIVGGTRLPEETEHRTPPPRADLAAPNVARQDETNSLIEGVSRQSRELKQQLDGMSRSITSIESQIVTPQDLDKAVAQIQVYAQRQLSYAQAELPPGSILAKEAEIRISTLGDGTEYSLPKRSQRVKLQEHASPIPPAESNLESLETGANFLRELNEKLIPPALELLSALPTRDQTYLQELAAAVDILAPKLGDWKVDIRHLYIPLQTGSNRIELHRPHGPAGRGIDCSCGYLTQDHLYQLVLVIEKPGSPIVAVLVSQGCRMDRYWQGYELLLNEKLSHAAGRLAKTTKAAFLKRAGLEGQEIYEMVKPMEVVFE